MHLCRHVSTCPVVRCLWLEGASWAVEARRKTGGRRVVVFVLGGVSHSECREMHALGAEIGREILLGSTSLLTPQSYIINLKELKQLDAFS